MIYLAILTNETNFGADRDTVIGVYNNLAGAEARIARLKTKYSGYNFRFRIDVCSINEACGNF